MNSWKKVALGGASLLAIATLAACGSSTSGNKTSSTPKASAKTVKGNITMWCDTTQLPMYKPIVAAFEKAYPGVTVKLTQSPTGSSNAKTDVTKDPSKAADVFETPNDQLGQLAANGDINPLSPAAEKVVKENDTAIAVQGVTNKDGSGNKMLYGYPFAVQAKILFYNKSKLSADDVKSFDTLTSKGTLAMTITDTQNGGQYTMVPNFLSNGVKLYGSDGLSLTGSTFNSKNGEQVLSWIRSLKTNKGVLDASTAAISDLQSGKADAYFDGPWDSTSIKKALGDNFAVATYPKVNYGSGEKQMQSFVGIEAFAVNATSKHQQAAAALAQYLTSKETQLTVWKKQGQIPVNKAAQQSSTITSNEMATTTIKQANMSTLMPGLPEMATMWNAAGPLIVGSYNGTISSSQYPAQLAKFNSTISKGSN